ncbi:RHS repeat-associated core domain-containing protein [Corallococcus interemptor]|uniref:RHS repeat domain-containing protein n=1 Tax=Corallococcus interemptor TaxID=2316720 RepID=UPI003D069B73
MLVVFYLNTLLSGCLNGYSPEEAPPHAQRSAKLDQGFNPPAPGAILPTEIDANGLTAGPIAGGAGVSMNGAALYSVPLWTPPARAGIGPNLSLGYSSQVGVGMAGMGWDVSGISRITRCGKSRALDGIESDPTLDDGPTGDRYCLDGQRLLLVAGSYGLAGSEYRAEFNGHEKIVALGVSEMGPTTFKVYQTDGTVRTYGPISPGFKTKVAYVPQTDTYTRTVEKYVRFEWGLSRVEDTMGNFMTIEYSILGSTQSGAEILPKTIRYTGSAILAPTRRVEFLYEDDPFATERWISGYKMRRGKRLVALEMYGPAPVAEGKLKTYRFKYRTGYHVREYASLLTALSECDGQGVCKEDLSFGYDIPPLEMRNQEVKFTFSGRVGRKQCYFGDLDGDGRDDVIYGAGDDRYYYRLSLGTEFGPPVLAKGLPVIGRQPNDDRTLPDVDTIAGESHALFDLNGDRRSEFMLTRYNWFWEWMGQGVPKERRAYAGNALYRNFKNSQTGEIEFAMEFQEPQDYPRSLQDWSITDLEGDGLPEYVAYSPSHAGIVYRTYYPTGMGPLTLLVNWQLKSPRQGFKTFQLGREGRSGYGDGRFATYSLDNVGVVGGFDGRHAPEDILTPADVNGDGLQDYVITHPFPHPSFPSTRMERTCYAINTGNGYEEPVCASTTNNLFADATLMVTDMNADGRAEFSTSWGLYLFGQTGSDWSDWTLKYPAPPSGATNPFRIGSVSGSSKNLADVNGDGVPDPYSCDTSSISVGVSKGSQQPLLVSVHNGAAHDSFEYSHVGDRTVYTPSEPALGVPGATPMHSGIWVVKRAFGGVGTLPAYGLRYQYAGSLTAKGRGWLGFEERTVTDENTGTRTTSTVTRSTPGHVALPDSTTVETPLGAMTHLEKQTWSYLFHPGPVVSVRKTASTTQTCDFNPQSGSQSCFQAVLNEANFDVYGNTTTTSSRTVWGVGFSQSASSFAQYAYEPPDLGRWLVSRPRQVDTQWTNALGTTNQAIEYQTHATTGLVERIIRSPGAAGVSEKLTTQFFYDDQGSPTAVEMSDPTGAVRRQSVGYALPDEMFPAWVQTGNIRREFSYHPGFGSLMSKRDEVGGETTFSYDGFGRERKVDGSGLADLTLSYQRRSGVEGGWITISSVGGGSETRLEVDAMGRPVLQQWVRAGPQPEPVYVQTEYRPDGKVKRVTQPHTANEPPAYTSLDTDALGRPVKLNRLDGSFRTWSYSQLQTEAVDELDRRTITQVNGLGQVVSRANVLTGGGQNLTTFEYNALGNLARITDPLGNLTTLEYDSLGRQTALVDSNLGRTTVVFNAFDEVVQRTDALGVTTFDRDGLGRPLNVTTSDGTTTYTWDSALGPQGVGRLASVMSPDGVKTEFAYDALGRPSETAWTVSGRRLSTAVTYDDFGRPSTFAYPEVGHASGSSRLVVQTTYDAAGNPASVRNALTGVDYWKALEINALGQVQRETAGNGVVTRRVFDKSGTLRFQEAKGAYLPVQQMAFGFAPTGNLLERHDLISKTSEDFEYDELDRLTNWQINERGVISRQAFEYDAIGNLKFHRINAGPGLTAAFAHDGPRAHAVTRRTQRGETQFLQYDAVGNQVDDGRGRTVEYTAFDLPKQISLNQETATYQYDGARRRVLKTLSNGDEVLSLPGIYERKRMSDVVEHLFDVTANGMLVAQVRWQEDGAGALTDEQVVYIHSDYQGTPSVVTDAAGNVLERIRFAPFGTRQAPGDLAQSMVAAPWVGKGFQGHSMDDESGLVDLGGRVYDPGLGVFLTPDPVVSASLNRYRFGLNNPLANTDPTGFDILGTGLDVLRTIGGGGGMSGGGLNPNPIPGHYDSVDWNYGSSHDPGGNNTINTGESTKPSTTPNNSRLYGQQSQTSPVTNIYGGGGSDATPRVNTPTGTWVNGAAHAAGELLSGLAFGTSLSLMPTYSAVVNTYGMGSQLGSSVKEYGVLGGLVDTFNPAGKALEHGWLASEAYDKGKSYAVGEHSFHATVAAVQTVMMASGLRKTGVNVKDLMTSINRARAAAMGAATEIGASGGAPRQAPFNPTGLKDNCVNGVCAYLESVRDGTLNLDAAHEPVRTNGGVINRVLSQIRNRVGLKWGSGQYNEMKTARSEQFFIVFRGSSRTISDHVAVGIVRNGRAMIYDPQSSQRFLNLSEFGPFTAYPIIFE